MFYAALSAVALSALALLPNKLSLASVAGVPKPPANRH
jgi:hypothetical protein